MKPEALTRWTPEDAAELYRIRSWGAGFFDVNAKGDVVVAPDGNGKPPVSLVDLVRQLRERNLNVPILLRFADVLATQIRKINKSFEETIKEAGYQGSYRCVYPIKVNQMYHVIRDVLEFGRPFHHGLEAGSKAELIAAIGRMTDPEALLVCNGYKDEEFIDLAMHGQRVGLQTLLVLEMPDELNLILERAKKWNVRPRLGVRAKLSSRAGGRWDGSAGDRGKFGLNASQILEIVDRLRAEKMLDCLQMLHYHVGSQVSDIRRIRTALSEACRFYAELVREGAAMGILNIGGGLAVDYDGSHTNSGSSSNYSVREYAADVIEVVMSIADETKIPHPMIVSESGRATAAYPSVLVFNILQARKFEPQSVPEKLPEGSGDMLKNLMHVRQTLSPRNTQEGYHDAVYYRDEIRTMFQLGKVSLRERALAENIFWDIIRRVATMAEDRKYVPDEIEGLAAAIADVYYGNLSLFQSLPDSWAIDQLFPVMPIHRLNEYPSRLGVLADITCDSDGKLDTFIDLQDVKHVLPLHEVNPDAEYYIGVFLVGAYQETLGDMHNLLGQVNVVHVRIEEDGRVSFEEELPGDSVEDVLRYVEYKPKKILASVRHTAERAVKAGRITAAERAEIVTAFEDGLRGYTYFER